MTSFSVKDCQFEKQGYSRGDFPKDNSSELHLNGVGLHFHNGLHSLRAEVGAKLRGPTRSGLNLRAMMLAHTQKETKTVNLPTEISRYYVKYSESYLERPSEKILVPPMTGLARSSLSGRDLRPQG